MSPCLCFCSVGCPNASSAWMTSWFWTKTRLHGRPMSQIRPENLPLPSMTAPFIRFACHRNFSQFSYWIICYLVSWRSNSIPILVRSFVQIRVWPCNFVHSSRRRVRIDALQDDQGALLSTLISFSNAVSRIFRCRFALFRLCAKLENRSWRLKSFWSRTLNPRCLARRSKFASRPQKTPPLFSCSAPRYANLLKLYK